MKKIALIGSAPSSVALAPHEDPSWVIWACSPGSVAHLRRVDAFFEIHKWEPHEPWFDINYRTFLANLQCPVFMIEPIAEVPKAVAYPKNEMLEKFGPFFFTSSLAWMFALAIEDGADEIGLWGVDMSAQEEWEFQRSGCHYFIQKARERGIKVTIPDQSDLLRPPTLYGFREADPMHIKLVTREKELRDHIAKAERDMAEARDRYWFFKGAYDANAYHMKTWVGDAKAIEMARTNPVLQSLPAVKPSINDPVVAETLPNSVGTVDYGDGSPQEKVTWTKPRKSNGKAEVGHGNA